MPLVPLPIRPGIVREGTDYSNEGGWIDCDRIRFRSGYPETIGGWQRVTDEQFLGVCRQIHGWQSLDDTIYIGMGTTEKYYVFSGDAFYDITPLRLTTSAGTVTFNGHPSDDHILTVQHTAHGAVAGDYVTFSSADSLGGNVTAAILNKEYTIEAISDSDEYTIALVNDAGATVAITASDTGNGGSATVAAYQINVGLGDNSPAAGYGTGAYGEGAYGNSSDTTSIVNRLRLWSADNFGEDLIANVRGGNIYYWDKTLGTSSRMVALSDLSGAQDAPTVANLILVSDQDRHCIAFGCDPFDDVGTQDPMLIRWCDREDISNWRIDTTTSAGSQRLSNGSEIVTAVHTGEVIVVLTDTAAFAMQFVGPSETFGFFPIATGVTIISQNAAVSAKDAIFWMGRENFFIYDGAVRELPCSVKEFVFDNLNFNQSEKVVGLVNSAFSEVWWFYPAGDSNENNRYVVYNYTEDLWYIGTMTRTAWEDLGFFTNPIAASTDGYLYYHEYGITDGESNPPVNLGAFIQSSPVDIGDGDKFAFVNRVIADLTFRGSTDPNPFINMILKASNYPTGQFTIDDDFNVTQTYTKMLTSQTKNESVRIRGRALSIRYEDATSPRTAWRIGRTRINMRSDGGR